MVPVSGRVRIAGDAESTALRGGELALIPAAAGAIELTPEGSATMLDIYLPD